MGATMLTYFIFIKVSILLRLVLTYAKLEL